MRKTALILITAVLLGAVSPLFANLGGDVRDPTMRQGLFYSWFYVLPAFVDHWFLPEGDAMTMALAVLVFTLQYLALFGVAAAAWRVLTVTMDFVKPHQHRVRLMDELDAAESACLDAR